MFFIQIQNLFSTIIIIIIFEFLSKDINNIGVADDSSKALIYLKGLK